MDYCKKCDVQMLHKATCDVCPNCGYIHDTFVLNGEMANDFNDSQDQAILDDYYDHYEE